MGARRLSVREFYAKVWEEYADPASHPITALCLSIQARLVGHHIARTKPRRILDLGCGPVPVCRTVSASISPWDPPGLRPRQTPPPGQPDPSPGPIPHRDETPKTGEPAGRGRGPSPAPDCPSPAWRRMESHGTLLVCADLVPAMLVAARREVPCAAVCLDAFRLPFRDGAFDFLWCALLADHIRHSGAWVRELFRVLAPGATLGMACWHRPSLPGERYPEDARMRYITADGEELTVPSLPTWEKTLACISDMDRHMEIEAHPVVPGAYLLEVAWATKAESGTPIPPHD